MTGYMLSDATLTVQQMGPDDGTIGTAVGSAVTVCVDSVSVSQSREFVDAGCLQDATPTNRVARTSWEIKIDAKLSIDPGFFIDLQDSTAVLVKVVITTADMTITGQGLLSAIEVSIGNPWTLHMTIIPYGSNLVIVAV